MTALTLATIGLCILSALIVWGTWWMDRKTPYNHARSTNRKRLP